MALDRDDLAARCLVAMLGNAERDGNGHNFACNATMFADALLARLASSAPVAPSPAAAPVDREGLARAIYQAVRNGNPLLSASPWGEVKDVTRRDAFNAADAAIAFLRGGAS